MSTKLFLAVPTVVLIALSISCAVGQGEVPVGVKKGDWIEYQVITTGNLTKGHNVTWARMEILEAQGTEISVNITTKAPDGTFTSDIENFNPAQGRVGIWFIIPANLNPGESFFDASMGKNVTIVGSKERIIAGEGRTVTYSRTPQRIKSWDKATGVFVETIDDMPPETMYAIVEKTNMWSAQTIGVEPSIFYASILAVLAVVLAALAAMLATARKKMTECKSKTSSRSPD